MQLLTYRCPQLLLLLCDAFDYHFVLSRFDRMYLSLAWSFTSLGRPARLVSE
jgi:hypothetical protein